MPRIPLNGTEIYYEDAGDGPPVIFHHGYTSSRECWEGVIPCLEDRYRCVAMDCRGAGDSGRPDSGYSLEQYARDVVALADALGFDRFRYVGLSMGGAVGFQLGIEHSARLEQVVLVAPAPASGLQVPESQFETALAAWESPDRERMIRDRILLSGRPNPDYLARAVDRSLSVSRGHYVDSWRSMAAFRAADRLAEMTTPTLIVAAAADGLLPANLADFQRLPNASLHVFSRVGHGIPYEVPEALADVVADFFEHSVVSAATLQARLRQPARV